MIWLLQISPLIVGTLTVIFFVALTAALMGFVMYLIFALERPFVGTLSVKPEAYSHVVEIWQQQERHE